MRNRLTITPGFCLRGTSLIRRAPDSSLRKGLFQIIKIRHGCEAEGNKTQERDSGIKN